MIQIGSKVQLLTIHYKDVNNAVTNLELLIIFNKKDNFLVKQTCKTMFSL